MGLDTFWGAFLGFVFGVLLEFVFSIVRNWRAKHNSLQAIIEELYDLEQQIYSAKNELEPAEIEITIPSWEAIIQTGNILLFTSKDYFKELMSTYLQVHELMEIEKKYPKGNSEELNKSRSETIKAIDGLKAYPTLNIFFNKVPKIIEKRKRHKDMGVHPITG